MVKTLLAKNIKPYKNISLTGDYVIEGTIPADAHITLKKGSLVVNGHVGTDAHLAVLGGNITIHGNVGDYASIAFRGGDLTVNGNLGDGVHIAPPLTPRSTATSKPHMTPGAASFLDTGESCSITAASITGRYIGDDVGLTSTSGDIRFEESGSRLTIDSARDLICKILGKVSSARVKGTYYYHTEERDCNVTASQVVCTNPSPPGTQVHTASHKGKTAYKPVCKGVAYDETRQVYKISPSKSSPPELVDLIVRLTSAGLYGEYTLGASPTKPEPIMVTVPSDSEMADYLHGMIQDYAKTQATTRRKYI